MCCCRSAARSRAMAAAASPTPTMTRSKTVSAASGRFRAVEQRARHPSPPRSHPKCAEPRGRGDWVARPDRTRSGVTAALDCSGSLTVTSVSKINQNGPFVIRTPNCSASGVGHPLGIVFRFPGGTGFPSSHQRRWQKRPQVCSCEDGCCDYTELRRPLIVKTFFDLVQRIRRGTFPTEFPC